MLAPCCSVVKNPPADTGDVSFITGLGRCPGEGNGNPLQYSCLGNPIDRGAWQTAESLSVEQRNMSSQEFHSEKKKKKGFKCVHVAGSEKYKGGPECQENSLQDSMAV